MQSNVPPTATPACKQAHGGSAVLHCLACAAQGVPEADTSRLEEAGWKARSNTRLSCP